MNISLTGNPKAISAQTGAMEALPAAEGAPPREPLLHTAPNLTVTTAPASTGAAGSIPPAEIEKAIVRDDALGKLVDRALEGLKVGGENGITRVLDCK